jgi:hypothetical protein
MICLLGDLDHRGCRASSCGDRDHLLHLPCWGLLCLCGDLSCCGISPVVVYLWLTRDLELQLGAWFHVGHQVLAMWLGKLVPLLTMLLVSSAQCSLFHRLTKMMSQDFAHDFLCFLALGYLHDVPAYGVVLHWCMMRCYAPPAITCLLRLLTRAFSLFHFSPTTGASFAGAGHTGTPLELPLLSLVV